MKRAHRRCFIFWSLSVTALVSHPFAAVAEYAPKGRRDPFVPLVTSDGQRLHPPGGDEEATAAFDSVAVQGIIFDPNAESFAMINGRLVREKEEIDGVRILKIEPTQVTVLVDGQIRRVSVHRSKKEEENPEP